MGWTARDKAAWDKQRFKDNRAKGLNVLSDEAKAILAANPTKKEAKKSRRKAKPAKNASIPKPKRFAPNPNARKSFYSSWEWKKVRMQALQRDGHRCGSCGASPKDGIRIVVDHIKPLGKFWQLRLSIDNLQVLCDDCNRGKGDWLEADFRSTDEYPEETDSLMAEFREIMRG